MNVVSADAWMLGAVVAAAAWLAVGGPSPEPARAVTLVVHNASDAPLRYDACALGLEQQVGATWRPLADAAWRGDDGRCAGASRWLPARARVAHTLQLHPALGPGVFRVVAVGNAPPALSSAPFRLAAR